MSGMYSPIVFYPLAIVLILFAIATIWFKNIFYSLLSAIMVFFLAAVLFYILGAQYNAVIQIAVYGLAIPVVLGLAIMFTNPQEKRVFENTSSGISFTIFLTSGLFLLSVIYLVQTSLAIVPDGFNFTDIPSTNPISALSAFGLGIFSRYVWGFELTSLILTIIVVGLSLFKKEIRVKGGK